MMLTGIMVPDRGTRQLSTYDREVEINRIIDRLRSINMKDFNPSDAEIYEAAEKISDVVQKQFDRSKMSKEEREALVIMDRLKGIDAGTQASVKVKLNLPNGNVVSITWTSTLTY